MSKRKAGAGRMGLIILCCVLAVVLAALLVFIIVANNLLGQVQHVEDTTLSSSQIEEFLDENTVTVTGPTIRDEDVDFGTEPTQTQESTQPTETQESTQPTEEIKTGNLVNILLIGQNANSASSWQKSEAMILCTFNKDTKTVTMTSFLPDIYVQVPGFGNYKLNMAYTIGGMKLLNQTLEENFGLKINGNIAVNYSSFMKLIDKAGGVEIQLTAAEADYLNDRGNWGVTTMGGWNLKEGQNTLTGEQAMGYALLKKIGGEAERTTRQRKVIAALLEQAKKKSLTELYDLAMDTAAMFSTNMTDNQIKAYITELAPMLMDMQVVTQRIPVDGSYSYKNVGNIGNCAVIDFDANRKVLAEMLNP